MFRVLSNLLLIFCCGAGTALGQKPNTTPFAGVTGKTVMAIQAHPDDAESRAAGAIALLKKQGNNIIYVVCTNDNKGTTDPQATQASHARVRRAEEEAAVKVLGVEKLEWLGYNDGELDMVPRIELREKITRLIRKYKPDIIFAHDPRDLDTHMDHRASAIAVLDSLIASPFPLYFPDQRDKEGLQPHAVSEVYWYDTPNPNVWVDIESTLDTKIDALACHVSQKGTRADCERTMKARAVEHGKPVGIKYAEAFRKAD